MIVFLEQIVLIFIVALIPCSFSRNLIKHDVSCQELSVDKNNDYARQNSNSTFRLKEEQETKKGLKKEFAFELNLHLNFARGEVINVGKILVI